MKKNHFFNIIEILILKFDFKKCIWYLLKSYKLDEYRKKLNIKLENNFKKIFFSKIVNRNLFGTTYSLNVFYILNC